MHAKLTLTIEQTLVEKARVYAQAKGHSLSEIIENYLKIITSEQETSDEITPIVKSLRGSFKAPESFDYKKELSDRLSEKYMQ
jgi:hypothetical protein